jgi:hypothetical protein
MFEKDPLRICLVELDRVWDPTRRTLLLRYRLGAAVAIFDTTHAGVGFRLRCTLDLTKATLFPTTDVPSTDRFTARLSPPFFLNFGLSFP